VIVEIDGGSPTPPFEQLRARLAELIATGQLAPGDRLPTVRQLAGDLGLAANTVARTYRTLESEGVIETRGRHGSFVAVPARPTAAQRRRQLADAAERYVAVARSLDAEDGEALAALRTALDRT
jgi:DNA-binding transcriptional regulator YhcF (GntR family)